MRVRLEQSKCQGHAQCHAIDERLFPLDEMGYSTLQPHKVEPADEERTRLGVAACPEQALVLEDDDQDG